jgi:hypothetical protein
VNALIGCVTLIGAIIEWIGRVVAWFAVGCVLTCFAMVVLRVPTMSMPLVALSAGVGGKLGCSWRSCPPKQARPAHPATSPFLCNNGM